MTDGGARGQARGDARRRRVRRSRADRTARGAARRRRDGDDRRSDRRRAVHAASAAKRSSRRISRPARRACSDFDALVIPGGHAPDKMRHAPRDGRSRARRDGGRQAGRRDLPRPAAADLGQRAARPHAHLLAVDRHRRQERRRPATSTSRSSRTATSSPRASRTTCRCSATRSSGRCPNARLAHGVTSSIMRLRGRQRAQARADRLERLRCRGWPDRRGGITQREQCDAILRRRMVREETSPPSLDRASPAGGSCPSARSCRADPSRRALMIADARRGPLPAHRPG